MKLMVGYHSEFNHHPGDAEFLHEARCRFRTIRSMILPRGEPACQQEPHRTPCQTITQQWKRANQGLEISIVVVMTDQQKLERPVRGPQLRLDLGRKWTG